MTRYKISEIEKLYPNWYCEASDLPYDDQKWIWENVPLPEKDEYKLRRSKTNGNVGVSVNGNENGTSKFSANSELNWYKSESVFELKRCTSSTPPSKIASLLQGIFRHWVSKDGHWLYVAQTYTPRTINWVMTATIKEHLRGGIRKNPPAYFTYLLKFRKKRKELRSTNDTYKSTTKNRSPYYDEK